MLNRCRLSIFNRRFFSFSNPAAFSTYHTDPEPGRNAVLTGTLDLTKAPPLSKRKAKKQRQLLLRMQIYPAQGDTVSEFMRAKYEKEARKYWDLFYKRNTDRFFKDRHYLQKEWGHLLGNPALPPIVSLTESGRALETTSVESEQPGTTSSRKATSPDQAGGALSSSVTRAPKSLNEVNLAAHNERLSNGFSPSAAKTVVLEVGCGAGNTVYPLLEENAKAFVYACDFSPRAVDLVKAHPSYDAERVHAFVCDLTEDDLQKEVLAQSVDIVSMIFVLSAISPEKMPGVLRNIGRVLKPGGHILLRDYAEGDLAQERLTGKVQKLGNNFYVRGDGTRAYYFSEEALLALFQGAGLECTDIRIHARELENRARKVVMNRRWIQGTFRKPPPDHHPSKESASGVGQQLESLTLSEAAKVSTSSPDVCTHGNAIIHGNPVEQLQTNGGGVQRKPFETAENIFLPPPSESALEEKRTGELGRENDAAEQQGTANPRPLFESGGAFEEMQVVESEIVNGAAKGRPAVGASLVTQEDDEGPSLGELFNTPLEYELREIAVAGKSFRYRALPNEHQHTQPSTGLLLWESARVLATYLNAHPDILKGRRVLEVGCGGIALPSILSAGETAGIVATDGDAAAMHLLDANIRLNSDVFELSKLRAERLRWGNDDDIARVRSLGGPDGYDVIIGADVVYVKEAVPLLFQTAAALLARNEAPPPADVMLTPPVLLLCHVIRRVAESEILEAARQAGFEHHRSIPFDDGNGTLANSGAIRLLALRRTAGFCNTK